MAIAFFGSAINVTPTAGVTSITVPVGSVSSIPAGAVIVAAFSRRTSALDSITLTGYTLLENAVGSANAIDVFYRVATGGEGDVTASWSTSVIASVAVSVYTGCDVSASPWVDSDAVADAAASSTISTPAVTNGVVGACAVTAYSNSFSGGTSWTFAAPQTERQDDVAIGSGVRAAIAVGDVLGAATGSVSYSATYDSTGSNTRKCSFLGFLKPLWGPESPSAAASAFSATPASTASAGQPSAAAVANDAVPAGGVSPSLLTASASASDAVASAGGSAGSPTAAAVAFDASTAVYQVGSPSASAAVEDAGTSVTVSSGSATAAASVSSPDPAVAVSAGQPTAAATVADASPAVSVVAGAPVAVAAAFDATAVASIEAPSFRTLVVEAESRAFVVLAEARGFAVPAEQRVIYVRP
ncbi:hypothetical protein [Streptomyces sp. NPDC055085]